MSCSVCHGYSSSKCPCCGEGIETTICPDCHGTGEAPYLAVNLSTYETIEVCKEDWLSLPEDEEEAEKFSLAGNPQDYCRFEEGGSVCLTCRGYGMIPKE